MNWKFWRRGSEKSPRGREGNSSFISISATAKEVGNSQDHLSCLHDLQLSSKELLGLQRIIGNQALIQMLKPKE